MGQYKRRSRFRSDLEPVATRLLDDTTRVSLFGEPIRRELPLCLPHLYCRVHSLQRYVFVRYTYKVGELRLLTVVAET
jgi:hypothetical protein